MFALRQALTQFATALFSLRILLALMASTSACGAPTSPLTASPPSAGPSHTLFASQIDDLVLTKNGACGVFTGGAARCWGAWDFALSSLSVSAGQLSDVVELRVGESIFESDDQLLPDFLCARLSDGAVQCCGSGYQGQLGLNVGAGKASMTPATIDGMPPNVAGLALGERHACARTDAGDAVCWGSNKHGQVGVGAAAGDKIPRPTPVSLPSKVVQVVASNMDSCALLDDGDVYCWGENWSGEAGAPYRTAWSPKLVEGARGSCQLSAASSTVCAVRVDGRVVCWGQLSSQLGPAFADAIAAEVPGIVDATTVAVGYSHSCAVRHDATLWCWGTGDQGELGDGRRTNSWKPVLVPLVGPITRVAIGKNNTCARLADHRWFCWGANRSAQVAPRAMTTIPSPRLLDLSQL